MCHGQIIGSSILAARRPFSCAICERIMPAGEEHVRHSIEPYDETRQNGDPRQEVWRLCKRCAVRWDVLVSDSGECPLDPIEALRGDAQAVGWRGMRDLFRQAKKRILG